MLNKALLGKWNWRLTNERNSLCRETISRKFGEMQGGLVLGGEQGQFWDRLVERNQERLSSYP